MVLKPRQRPVTLAVIADQLGITRMAVSKALRGHKDISAETRRRVLAKATELNYQVNLTALALRSRQNKLVGIVVPTFLHSFFSEMVEGAGRALEAQGYQTLVAVTGESAEREVHQIEGLLARQVDGLIVASCQRRDRSGVFQRAKGRGVPVVLAGRRLGNFETSYVSVDNFEVGRIATEHLLSQGRRRIAHLCGPENSTSDLRRKGYRAALRDARVRVPAGYVAGNSDADDAVAQATRRLLRHSRMPDAIFCYNDQMAITALRTILAEGMRVPQDIAIVGVGNIRFSDVLAVPLTTIDQQPQEIGRTAAKLLLENANGAGIRQTILPARLVVRESSGAAPVSSGGSSED